MSTEQRKITNVICFLIALIVTILMMDKAYVEWSKYGPYGWLQFISSLMIHGGLGVIVYMILKLLGKAIGTYLDNLEMKIKEEE